MELLSGDCIRIPLRFMLMSRCRTISLHTNMSVREQASDSQFGASLHRS